ncbi:tail fiber domain-containing protein [Wenzhouxiangella sp. XN201]|uniref:tail fiber domain-containing protein n=1 Tax=Wenzhouxiangella sp. XN201 TaxID=2710755 RepID=UPI0013C68FB8|nr:tail fiber domain-containing protein [Wenzhouxiangella sp. XN201]NEZ04097.1 tail fiber domain-containing protein [Wenzhouxiangella sp. XN201]
MNVCIPRSLLVGILALAVSAVGFSAQPDELFQTHVYSDTVLIEPGADKAFDFDVDLIVSGPEGFYYRESFSAGSVVEFTPSRLPGRSLSDGVYQYELRITGTGLNMVRGDHEALHFPAGSVTMLDSPHSGTFAIADGSFVSPDIDEPVAQHESSGKDSGSFSLQTDDADGGGSRDQVIVDDLVVQGSECVGIDCVNGETFGFDTIRMKENNVRLQFNDTSSSSSFPNNNWQIRANDSANGGANYLGIIDQGASGSSEAGTRLFTVSAGAPAHSLFVASTGRVGLRTSTPVLDLHVNTNNTPGIRLEQNSSGGFSAQTWDIAGNEANFFVRDVTGGSRLPFRIRPGAPTSSIDIAASGNVGIGNSSPNQPLHIKRTDNTAQLLIEDTGVGNQRLLSLVNHGVPAMHLQDASQGNVNWTFSVAGTQNVDERFQLNKVGSGQVEMQLFADGSAEFAGDVTANGVLLTSARATKTDFKPVKAEEILQKLVSLEISEWRYRKEPKGTRHIGAMAEEFQAAFGLSDGKTLNMIDTTGISFAAIKALKQELDDKQTEVDALSAKVELLEKAVDALVSQASMN